MGELLEIASRDGLVPFDTYVVKVASRCNLNCSYCYMYNLQDDTWRGQPSVMAESVTASLGWRIREHLASHNRRSVHVILHGGEPLLLGKKRLRSWVSILRQNLGPDIRLGLSMQSNGALINREWVDLLAELGIGVGISVDGPREIHDRQRVDHRGQGSYDRVLHGIRALQAHPEGRRIFSSVMAVVDTRVSPDDMFAFWQELGVEGFDLTLPHANHVHPPPRGRWSYGDWMVRFFDLWLDQNRPDRRVRFFQNMMRCLFGAPISTDNIGGRPVGVVVVETDGSLEPTDAFKCCEDGMTKLGLNILHDPINHLYRVPMVRTLQGGRTQLGETCRSCPVVSVCGGGYMPHRYGADRQFNHPSVYCRDLEQIIRHIRSRTLSSLSDELTDQLLAGGPR